MADYNHAFAFVHKKREKSIQPASDIAPGVGGCGGQACNSMQYRPKSAVHMLPLPRNRHVDFFLSGDVVSEQQASG
jgi:hypothetical protein